MKAIFSHKLKDFIER